VKEVPRKSRYYDTEVKLRVYKHVQDLDTHGHSHSDRDGHGHGHGKLISETNI
jgi:hypothetical protein